MRERNVAADIALGAFAGLTATWVMGKATSYLYEHEDAVARKREDDARGGKTAYAIAAQKTASLMHRQLSEDQEKKYGSAIHWGLGVGAGAAYGALRRRMHFLSAGQGVAFGVAFWLLIDEGANTALQLTAAPSAFPWQAHARGLAGHLVFGVVADTVLDLADMVG